MEKLLPMFKKVWTAEMIESHIHMTHDNKEPLNSHYYATQYPSVYAAAERLFGSWGEAINACGFNYNEIRKYKVWNRSKVTETIREMAQAGKNISSQKAQKEHKSLYMAAIRYYRSWGKAVMAATWATASVRSSAISPKKAGFVSDSFRLRSRSQAGVSSERVHLS